MRVGKTRNALPTSASLDLPEIVEKLNDAALQTRVRAAARSAALAQLREEGLELTPAQWGELASILMASTTRDAEDVMAGAAAVVIGIALSDARLKSDIVRVGGLPSGISLYEFSYRGFSSRWRGVIAQDVRRFAPAAVCADPSGFLMVDYDALGIAVRRA